jgi:acyl carrier protein
VVARDNPSLLIDVARSAVAELRGRDLYGLRVSLDSSLQNDLGLDSLARVELLHRVEQAFRVRLQDDAFASAATLRDLLFAVENAGARSADAQPGPVGAPPAETAEPAPESAATLLDVLRWHVERHPSAAGLTLLAPDGERSITYADLWNRAAATCGALQTRGVVPGESIALMLPTGADYFTAFMGVLFRGCVPVPIYPPAHATQLEEHIRRHAKLLTNARPGSGRFTWAGSWPRSSPARRRSR